MLKKNFLFVDSFNTSSEMLCDNCLMDKDNSEEFERAILAKQTKCSSCNAIVYAPKFSENDISKCNTYLNTKYGSVTQ